MADDRSILEKTSRITRSKDQARQSCNRMSRFYGFLSNSSEKRFVKTAVQYWEGRYLDSG